MVMIVAGEGVQDLVGALVGEERTTADQDDLDEGRGDFAEQDCRREDERKLVEQRATGDPLDDREFALGSKPLDVLRGDCRIVDDDTSRLHRGATRRRADIIDRRRCEFRQRGDIVEQTYETTSHGSEN